MDVNKKIKDAIEEMAALDKSFKESEEIYKLKKNKLASTIKKFMGDNKIDALDFINKAHNIYKVKFVQPKKIIFDADKLESKIDRDLCALFISKEYQINDIISFIAYMKSIGADPKIVRSYLDIKKKVDEKKLDELSELGQISEDDIKGCYQVKEISSYIKISEVENEEGGGE